MFKRGLFDSQIESFAQETVFEVISVSTVSVLCLFGKFLLKCLIADQVIIKLCEVIKTGDFTIINAMKTFPICLNFE